MPICFKCSPSENKLHCYSHGLCGIDFFGTTFYLGEKIAFCSQECGLNFYKSVEISRFKPYALKF